METKLNNNLLVGLKIIFVLLSLIMVVMSLNINIYKLKILIPKYDVEELLKYVAMFGLICMNIGSFGAVMYYKYYKTKPQIRFILLTLLIWDIALFFKLTTSAGIIYYSRVNSEFMYREGFFMAMKKYRTNEQVRKTINSIHIAHVCCGNYNYTEWFKIDWEITSQKLKIGFPASCCKKVIPDIICVNQIEYQEMKKLLPKHMACLEILKWWLSFSHLCLVYLFSIIAFIQLITIVLSVTIISYI